MMADSKQGWIVVGGDLFYVNLKTREVVGVVRRVMNLKEYGSGFNRQFELWRMAGETSVSTEREVGFLWDEDADYKVPPTDELRAADFGDPTPMEIQGGKTITAEEMRAKVDSSRPPVVISLIGGTLGPPGAVDLIYASDGGTYTDGV